MAGINPLVRYGAVALVGAGMGAITNRVMDSSPNMSQLTVAGLEGTMAGLLIARGALTTAERPLLAAGAVGLTGGAAGGAALALVQDVMPAMPQNP